jgi:hypothetical protein
MTRRTTTILASLAALLAAAMPADAGAATHQATHQDSLNWAGYAASKPGVRFRRVASTWVQPAASCAAGERRYSAYWVGLGGFHSTSKALEQIGSQVDCSSTGQAFYSAWYELVPAASMPIHLAVHPGDTLSASVTVSHGKVKLYLANRTRGTHFAKQLRPKQLDVTAADWIVEAPSACDDNGCHTLPLANFGSASFTGATATTTDGHAGPIADPAWSSTALALAPAAVGSFDATIGFGSSSAGATPSDLSPSGDGFTVTYNDGTAPAPAPETPVPTAPVPTAPVPAAPAAPVGPPPPVGQAPAPIAPLPGPTGQVPSPLGQRAALAP